MGVSEEAVETAAGEYLSLPVNFGADDPTTRTAEYDAFIAGARWVLNEFDRVLTDLGA